MVEINYSQGYQTGSGDPLPPKPFEGQVLFGPDRSLVTITSVETQGGVVQADVVHRLHTQINGPSGLRALLAQAIGNGI
jgi:hypothetical protein